MTDNIDCPGATANWVEWGNLSPDLGLLWNWGRQVPLEDSTVTHVRTHHPVGQGLFHSGSIRMGGTAGPFRYVYDCGGDPQHVAQAAGRFGAFLEQEASGRGIDVVFLSHFHKDHYNGLRDLLNSCGGALVLVAPLINDAIDRLLSIGDDLDSLDTSQQAFLVDGVTGFARELGISNVIQVRSSRNPGLSDRRPSDETIQMMDLALDDGFRFGVMGPEGEFNGSLPIEIDDTQHLVVATSQERPIWEFWLHLDRQVDERRGHFVDYLEKELIASGVLPKFVSLTEWLEDSNNLESLLNNAHLRSFVRAAYESIVGRKINVTSLSVLAGPTKPRKSRWRAYSNHGSAMPSQAMSGRVDWLGTGDRRLRSRIEVEAYAAHFGGRLMNLATFVVPHHGAGSDLSSEIDGRISALLAPVSYGCPNRYGHPRITSTKAVEKAGMSLVHVNNSPSWLVEHAVVWW